MPLTLPAAPSPPTLSNPGIFETDASAFLAWMAAVATAVTGSALTVGDFGLGGAGNVLPPGNNANNATAPGLYSMTPTTANGPTGNTAALRVERSYNVVLQIASTSIGVYRRRSSDNGTTWSAWLLDMERGSNANGQYVRFADGTQICSRALLVNGISANSAIGSVYRQATPGDYAFPAAFSTCDYASAAVLASDDAAIRNNALGVKLRTGSSVRAPDWSGLTLISATSVTGTSGEITVISLFAVGTWF